MMALQISTDFNQSVLEILTRIAERLDALECKLSYIETDSEDKKDSQTFDEFAQYYFEKFRWRRVSPETKKRDLRRYNKYLLSTFGDLPLNRITPQHCQDLIDRLIDKPKTAHEILSLSSVIFKSAIKHKFVDANPCDVVYIPEYEKQHGKALTKDEEQMLLSATSGTPYQVMFAVALYTGLRPNEYKSARIEAGFIVARNSKQKDGKEHKKKIPISPMLDPYVANLTEIRFICPNRLRMKLKDILFDHKLYDLRTTFYTRCQECGVSDVARKLFVGHSLGVLADTYTDVSDEYLIKEAQKLVY